MLRWSVLLLTWLLVAAPAAAQEVTLEVEFRTRYPLKIWAMTTPERGYQYLGHTNQKVRLGLSRGTAEAAVRFAPVWSDQGEASAPVTIPVGILNRDRVWPPGDVYQPELSLKLRVLLFLRYRWFWLIPPFALLAWLIGKARRHLRKYHHQRVIAELVADCDPADPYEGRRLGNYRMLSKLGQGGMASVYRAVPEDTPEAGDSVAIKVIQPSQAKEEDFLSRFEREIAVCSRLNHPHVVKVLDFGYHESVPYLVMEYVRGRPLPPGPHSLAKTWELVGPAFEAVGYAHHQGVIHRDLKPDNILLEQDTGRVVVMDFGLARRNDLKTITASGHVLGTPAYMAPEQIKGLVDPAIDQYALGIITYELLEGHPPFQHQDAVQLVMAHLQEPMPEPSKTPPEVAEVLRKMLAKNAEERYPDLKEAAQALKRAMKSAQ